MAPSPPSARPESLPVVDLRLLSQSELSSLSHSSASRTDRDAIHDGLLIPKIDRSVFNESAGSRKQTFSRLRLAPSAAAAARRSLAHSRPPEPPGPDDLRVIELLKQLFASDSDHRSEADLVPARVEFSGGDEAVPPRIVAGGSGFKAEPGRERSGDGGVDVDVDVAGCENEAVVPSDSASLKIPRHVVLGLVSNGEESLKRKRGWPKTVPMSLPVPFEIPDSPLVNTVSLDSGTGKLLEPPLENGNPVVEILGNSLDAKRSDSLALDFWTSKVEVEPPPKSNNVLVENRVEGFGAENSGNSLAVLCSSIADSVPQNSKVSKVEPPSQIKNPVLESIPKGVGPEIVGNSLAVPHIFAADSVALIQTPPPNPDSIASVQTTTLNSASIAPILSPPPNSDSLASIQPMALNSGSVALILSPPLNSDSLTSVKTKALNSGSIAAILTLPSNSDCLASVQTTALSSSSAAPILTPPRDSDYLASVQMTALDSGSVAPILTPPPHAISMKQKIRRPTKHLKAHDQGLASRPPSSSEIPYQEEAANISIPQNARPSSVPPLSNPPSDHAAPDLVPTATAVAMNVVEPIFPKVEALQESSASEAKRKRGRPRKGEAPPVSSPRARVKKLVREVKLENLERVNGNGTVVDLAALGTLEDPFREELRRRTGHLATEAELMGFLEGVPGEWASWRRKKRIVPASELGDALPLGWNVLLCLKRRDSRFWLICRRYISPGGVQFDSCKEVSSYLINAFRPQQRDQSECFPADGITQASIEVGFNLSTGQGLNRSYEDPKRSNDLVSCSRVPVTSAVTDQSTPRSFLETMNPSEIGVQNATNSHHDSMKSTGQDPNISYEDPKRSNELVSCSRVPVTSAVTDQSTPRSFLETMNPSEIGVRNAKKSHHDSMKSTGQDPNISYEDPKRSNELVSCSRVPDTSAVADQSTPRSFLETMNPGAKKSHHDSMLSFDERNSLDHQANFTKANPHRDGVLTNFGKYQCQFCQCLFDNIDRYNGHVLVHAQNCSESNTILLQPTNIPERSSLSSSFSPTSLKIQEPIDINLEDSCGLEANGNLKLDTPYQLCTEKEIEETVSKSCTYSHNDSFVLFSNEERVTNCSKGDVDRESYEKRIKTSYLTNEELGKLDEPWLDMGFQGNLFAPFDDEALNNSSSNVVDMIRADDSRNCKAGEYSVSFDHNQTKTREVTSSSRTEQEDFSRGSSVLLSSYEHGYAFKDSPVPNKKEKEVKQDKFFEPEHQGRSDHARYYDFINNKKVSSSSSVGSSRNKEVKEFWNDETLQDSGRVDTMIDTNSGRRTNVTRNSERVSQEIPGSGQVHGDSSNREREVTRHFDFGFTYPQQIHGVDATQNVFTNALWDQPKLDANQFRHNVVASESAQNSRPCGNVMPGLPWRVDDQNFRPGRIPDTSSVQMSTSFSNFGPQRHKDVYGGNPGVSERFDDLSGFDGLGSASTQQQQSQYNFLGAQTTPNLNDSRDLSPKQDFDSLFWFPKEDTIPFPKATVRHPILATCVWCRKEFYHQDVGSQMKSGSMGLMCTTCQTKFPG